MILSTLWPKISYIIQLLCACIVYIFPAKKKKKFLLYSTVSFLLLLLLSYLLNTLYSLHDLDFFMFIYWFCYIIMGILFIRLIVNTSWSEVFFYATCAYATQHTAYDFCIIYLYFQKNSPFILFIIYICVYFLFYNFFAKKLSKFNNFGNLKKEFIPMITIIALVLILSVLETSNNTILIINNKEKIYYRICDALCCIYVLWVNISLIENINLQKELNGISKTWNQQSNQYQLTSNAIENINRKCHDLRHQIRAFRNADISDTNKKTEFLDAIENDIMIYDTNLATGNKPLDTILMKYGLFCKNNSIKWTCIADGSKLNFMAIQDLYALFENAFENAVEAVLKLEDEKKRIINVNIRLVNKLIEIQILNYFSGNIQMYKGLPETIKQDKINHGYGVKSIKYTAEKYNGTITITTKNEIFNLQILIPII